MRSVELYLHFAQVSGGRKGHISISILIRWRVNQIGRWLRLRILLSELPNRILMRIRLAVCHALAL